MGAYARRMERLDDTKIASDADMEPSNLSSAGAEAAHRDNSLNLAELAYAQIEERIVTCTLEPGRHLSIQDLQTMTGLGRTPIHQAVSRLAADTLVVVRPRHGLRIAPVDLARERALLPLRRDIERFVVRLAASRAGLSHRNQFLHIARALRANADGMSIIAFNQLDRRIDQLMIAAAGEPFLEHTLRPLHTIFRRIGWIYHSWVRAGEGLGQTVASHLSILDAVAAGRIKDAAAASDRLVAFSDSMFDVIANEIDPALLDSTFARHAAV
jgi:DNA-binding GntR family transcriptional regulator